METTLVDCKEIIVSLQKDLKDYECSIFKAHSDLKIAQDEYKAIEQKCIGQQQFIENSKRENQSLHKKVMELNNLI